MIDFMVCDDNEIFRKDIIKVIDNYMMKNNYSYKVFPFNDYNQKFMNELEKNTNYRIYILDIETPSKSGIDVARMIRRKDKESAIIFLTSHDECAFAVLKSCTNFLTFISKYDDYEENLENAIKEAIELLGIKKILSFVDHNVSYTIITKSILYITKDTVNRKTIIVTDSNTFKVYTSMSELSLQLGNTFKQTHRSCLVNKQRIEKIDNNNNIITFDNGIKLDLLSNRYKKELVENE